MIIIMWPEERKNKCDDKKFLNLKIGSVIFIGTNQCSLSLFFMYSLSKIKETIYKQTFEKNLSQNKKYMCYTITSNKFMVFFHWEN